MASNRLKTFDDIVQKVLSKVRQPDSEDTIVDDIKSFINDRYIKVCGKAKWRWRRRERVLRVIGKYATGTVSVTNGSRTATFTGATIDEETLNQKLRVAGDSEYYKIIAVNDATNVVKLDAPYHGTTDTDATFTISKDEYGLWPDFSEFDDIKNFYRSTGIEICGPRKIHELKTRFPFRSGRITHISIDGRAPYDNVKLGAGKFILGHELLGIPESIKAIVFPMVPTSDQLIPITYIKRIQPLENDNDEPLMDPEDRIILVDGACADWCATTKDNDGFQIHERDFQMKLDQMLADNQESDDFAQFVVGRPYDRSTVGYSSIYAGTAFDRDED